VGKETVIACRDCESRGTCIDDRENDGGKAKCVSLNEKNNASHGHNGSEEQEKQVNP